jgi:hypothetical protein
MMLQGSGTKPNTATPSQSSFPTILAHLRPIDGFRTKRSPPSNWTWSRKRRWCPMRIDGPGGMWPTSCWCRKRIASSGSWPKARCGSAAHWCGPGLEADLSMGRSRRLHASAANRPTGRDGHRFAVPSRLAVRSHARQRARIRIGQFPTGSPADAEAAFDLMHRVHPREFKYDPSATSVATPLAEVSRPKNVAASARIFRTP